MSSRNLDDLDDDEETLVLKKEARPRAFLAAIMESKSWIEGLVGEWVSRSWMNSLNAVGRGVRMGGGGLGSGRKGWDKAYPASA